MKAKNVSLLMLVSLTFILIFNSLIIPSLGAVGDKTYSDNLVGYWKMEGDTKDDTENKNHGNLIGNAKLVDTKSCDPKILGNQSVELDGSGDYIKVEDDSSLNPLNKFSISLWINIDSISGTLGILCKGLDDTFVGVDSQGFFLTLSSGYVNIWIYSSSWDNLADSTELITNVWYHIGCVYNGSGFELYRNGEMTSRTDGIGTMANSNYPLLIGAMNVSNDGGTSHYIDGTMDEVAIWNDTQSPSMMKEIYEDGIPFDVEEEEEMPDDNFMYILTISAVTIGLFVGAVAISLLIRQRSIQKRAGKGTQKLRGKQQPK